MAVTQIDLGAVVQSYLTALEARDLERCVSFYTEDATINFAGGEYTGAEAIREWHEERFEANFQIKKVESISTKGSQVRIELAVASNRLKSFHIKSLRGKGTFLFAGDKMREVDLSLAGINPFASWQ